jgi:hypothetical protein
VGSFKLNLHQIARLQVNSDIEGHTALADFAPASWQWRLGNSIRQDAHWQIDQMSLPTAGIRGRESHLRQMASAWMLLLAQTAFKLRRIKDGHRSAWCVFVSE